MQWQKWDAHSWWDLCHKFVDFKRLLFLNYSSQCIDFVVCQVLRLAFGISLCNHPLTSSVAMLKVPHCVVFFFSPGLKLFGLLCVWSFSHLVHVVVLLCLSSARSFLLARYSWNLPWSPGGLLLFFFFTSAIQICYHCWRMCLGAQSTQDRLQDSNCVWGTCYVLFLCDTSSGTLQPAAYRSGLKALPACSMSGFSCCIPSDLLNWSISCQKPSWQETFWL